MQAKYYGAAAQYNKQNDSKFGNIIKIAGLLLIVLLVLTVGFYLVSSLTSSNKNEAAQLVAREQQLLAYIDEYGPDISNADLAVANSSAQALVASDNYALTTALASVYGLSKIPSSITATEADTTSETKLTTAKSQNNYNQAYASILATKVASTEELALTVAQNSKGSMKTAAATAAENLAEIYNQISELGL